MSDLASVTLDDAALPDPGPDLAQERRVALFDLAEIARFRLSGGPPPPYDLTLRADAEALTFATRGASFALPLGPLDNIARDYRALCDTYVEAVRAQPPARIAEIDAARREIHGIGADALRGALAPHAETDDATARALFLVAASLLRG